MSGELINDHFQNFKRYNIPKAQLIIADIPYNVGNNAYASSPQWYVDGQISEGQSEVAGKQFFDTDKAFRISEFMEFTARLLKKEPREKSEAPCMIVFCAFEQIPEVIKQGKERGGFAHYIPLVFRKDFYPKFSKRTCGWWETPSTRSCFTETSSRSSETSVRMVPRGWFSTAWTG